MPMQRLRRGWVAVPTHKRLRGPVTLTPEQVTKIQEWALALERESRDQRLRPKAREMAHYALQQAAHLFAGMGFAATTGTDGLRVYEPLSAEEQAAVIERIEEDDDFYAALRESGGDYYSSMP